MFPGLTGYSGSGHAAEACGFGASGIIPVNAAGRYGLNCVNVYIDSFMAKIKTNVVF